MEPHLFVNFRCAPSKCAQDVAAASFSAYANSKKLLPKPPTMPDADAQPPVRGSGTHSLNFRKTIRERFPAVDFRDHRVWWPFFVAEPLASEKSGIAKN
jgi:hypothetical protein